MMRSLFAGVSGLKTHQTKMDVIGNNIANVNTTAFKSSSIVFSDLMSQTTQKASGPNAVTGTGGTNARQIGLGVKSGAISASITTQGASQSTGNPFDIMITGEAFFVVNNGTENFFTRDGSFYIDGAGNLAMTSTGYNVMGWEVGEDMKIKQDTVKPLKIMNEKNMTYHAEATSKAVMAGIMDRNEPNAASASGKTVNLNFFDQQGYSYTARFNFKQSDNPYNYSVEIDKILDSVGNEVDISNLRFGNYSSQARQSTVGFDATAYAWDSTGKILSSGSDQLADLSQMIEGDSFKDGTAEVTLTVGGETVTTTVQECFDNIAKAHGYEGSTEEFLNLYKDVEVDGEDSPVRLTVEDMLLNLAKNGANADDATIFPTNLGSANTLAVDGRMFTGMTIQYNEATGKFAGVGGVTTNTTMNLNLSEIGGNFSNIEIDFSDTMSADNKGTSTIAADKGDADGLGTGRRIGDMIGVSIQQNGEIYASYDNGMTKLLGQIAVAEFANASGLEKQGDNLYSATLNSGEFDGTGKDITANGGYMSTGMLEMSNVDLSSEFTQMITTQRGFQANSRIITVSDTLLEELTNLKR